MTTSLMLQKMKKLKVMKVDLVDKQRREVEMDGDSFGEKVLEECSHPI